MNQYRFRTGSEGELVLQVGVESDFDPYYNHTRKLTWRDATVSDIPVNDPFASTGFQHILGQQWEAKP